MKSNWKLDYPEFASDRHIIQSLTFNVQLKLKGIMIMPVRKRKQGMAATGPQKVKSLQQV